MIKAVDTLVPQEVPPGSVVDPDKWMEIPLRDSDTPRMKAFDVTAAAMIKAVNTLIPQEVPPGSGELAATDGIEIGRGGVPIRGRAEERLWREPGRG